MELNSSARADESSPPDEQGDVTRFLQTFRANGAPVTDELVLRLYRELRQLASYHLRSERDNHTLQSTDLVNEAYLRLSGVEGFSNRGHFFRVAAKVMRQVLVDHARARRAKKRGGEKLFVQLGASAPDPPVPQTRSADEYLDLDEALSELTQLDPRQAQIIELRFIVGLNEDEVCEVLGIAARTVRRDWNSGRAWLYGRLKRKQPPAS